MRKWLHLDNPIRFNEKLTWLKLNNRVELYSRLVDKYAVKKYVSSMIGEEYIIPTIGVYDKWEDINFHALPNQFVLKCTHDSQSTLVCKDKENFDFKKAKKKTKKCLGRNFYYLGREYPYKKVPPRIIIEQYIREDGGLKDYKFLCFDGEPKILLFVQGREGIHSVDFYDINLNRLPIARENHPNSAQDIVKPRNWDIMLSLARRLSKNMPHVRIDFYNINGKIYFGEYTFFTNDGCSRFVPDEWDFKIGDWLKINNPSKYET